MAQCRHLNGELERDIGAVTADDWDDNRHPCLGRCSEPNVRFSREGQPQQQPGVGRAICHERLNDSRVPEPLWCDVRSEARFAICTNEQLT